MFWWIWSGDTAAVAEFSPHSWRRFAPMKTGKSWTSFSPGLNRNTQAHPPGRIWPFLAEHRRTSCQLPLCPRYCRMFGRGSVKTMCCAGGRRRSQKSSSGCILRFYRCRFYRHRPMCLTGSCWIMWVLSELLLVGLSLYLADCFIWWYNVSKR